jgi:hypothetical protein
LIGEQLREVVRVGHVVDGDEIEAIGVGADLQRRPARFGPAG